MWIIGRIMLVILMVIGVLLFAAGVASLVGADSWVGQIEDEDLDTGIFIGAGAGGVALGVIILAVSSIFLFRRHKPKIVIEETKAPEE